MARCWLCRSTLGPTVLEHQTAERLQFRERRWRSALAHLVSPSTDALMSPDTGRDGPSSVAAARAVDEAPGPGGASRAAGGRTTWRSGERRPQSGREEGPAARQSHPGRRGAKSTPYLAGPRRSACAGAQRAAYKQSAASRRPSPSLRGAGRARVQAGPYGPCAGLPGSGTHPVRTVRVTAVQAAPAEAYPTRSAIAAQSTSAMRSATAFLRLAAATAR